MRDIFVDQIRRQPLLDGAARPRPPANLPACASLSTPASTACWFEQLALHLHFEAGVISFGALKLIFGVQNVALQFRIAELKNDCVRLHDCARTNHDPLDARLRLRRNPANLLGHQRPQPAHLAQHRPALHGVHPHRRPIHRRRRRTQPRKPHRRPAEQDNGAHSVGEAPHRPDSRVAWQCDVHSYVCHPEESAIRLAGDERISTARHSYRRAVIGSTRVARRAGTYGCDRELRRSLWPPQSRSEPGSLPAGRVLGCAATALAPEREWRSDRQAGNDHPQRLDKHRAHGVASLCSQRHADADLAGAACYCVR